VKDKLRILIVHNRYRLPGGEDTVVSTEARLLRDRGHDVEEYIESNDEPFGLADSARLYWSPGAGQKLERAARAFAPDVAHFHNVFYRITPSSYWNLKLVPVVQTLHNFRLGCVNGRLSRNGVPCELCLGRLSFWPGVYYSCFHNSALQSFALATSIKAHRLIGSFSRVDTFIALSRFAAVRHLRYGIPETKLVIKPNCVYPDPGLVAADREPFCLFAGRLEIDKGVRVLLEAARLVPSGIQICIAGGGPLEHEVVAASASLPNVRFLGQLPRDAVLDLMRKARCLVFPALAYENFPMTLAEAFSIGLPVVASNLGAAAEIIQHGSTGLLFEVGSPVALSERLAELWHDSARLDRIRAAARSVFEARFSGNATYEQLQDIYGSAIKRASHPI
jgi:glycosyltransferase involved in cell wall biosynthesis